LFRISMETTGCEGLVLNVSISRKVVHRKPRIFSLITPSRPN
jgi:hypothetical protein